MKKSYPSDISKEALEQIRPAPERVRKRTWPRTVDLCEVFCAARRLFLLKSGCQWRMLPEDFPKWRSVHSYFAKWGEPGPVSSLDKQQPFDRLQARIAALKAKRAAIRTANAALLPAMLVQAFSGGG
jgi:transposase